MKQLYILLFLSVVLLTSCKDNVELTFDNPTKNILTLKLDTLSVTIPSKDLLKIEIEKGEHQLILENDSVIKFNFTDLEYFINPSLSEYLVSEEYFGPEQFAENFISKISRKEVSFLGMTLHGNYDIIKDAIHRVTWDFGPREILPKKVDVEEDQTYASRIKVYDVDEFMDVFLKTENN